MRILVSLLSVIIVLSVVGLMMDDLLSCCANKDTQGAKGGEEDG